MSHEKSTIRFLICVFTAIVLTSCEGGSSSNGCQNPDDRASDGSRCGGRAASVKAGGN